MGLRLTKGVEDAVGKSVGRRKRLPHFGARVGQALSPANRRLQRSRCLFKTYSTPQSAPANPFCDRSEPAAALHPDGAITRCNCGAPRSARLGIHMLPSANSTLDTKPVMPQSPAAFLRASETSRWSFRESGSFVPAPDSMQPEPIQPGIAVRHDPPESSRFRDSCMGRSERFFTSRRGARASLPAMRAIPPMGSTANPASAGMQTALVFQARNS